MVSSMKQPQNPHHAFLMVLNPIKPTFRTPHLNDLSFAFDTSLQETLLYLDMQGDYALNSRLSSSTPNFMNLVSEGMVKVRIPSSKRGSYNELPK